MKKVIIKHKNWELMMEMTETKWQKCSIEMASG